VKRFKRLEHLRGFLEIAGCYHNCASARLASRQRIRQDFGDIVIGNLPTEAARGTGVKNSRRALYRIKKLGAFTAQSAA